MAPDADPVDGSAGPVEEQVGAIDEPVAREGLPAGAPPLIQPRLPPLSPFRIGLTGTLGAMVAYGLAQAVIQARGVLILIVVAMFIALGLNPLVELLARRGLRRGFGVLIVFLGVAALVALALIALVPLLTEQLTTLFNSAPDILQSLLRNPQVADLNDRFQIITKATEFLTSSTLVSQLFGGIFGAGKFVVSTVFSGLTLLILTLYFLASLPMIKGAIYRMAPASRRARVRSLADQMFSRISAYLSGMFLVVSTAGVTSFIFLWIAGLREYALALAVVVAVFDFIPMIGASIAAVIVCIVAFVHSTPSGIAAVIFFIVYQQMENYLIQPRVMRRSVKVPGPVTVIAALLGGTLLGVVGALIAVPTAAALLLLLREVIQPRLDAS